MAAPGSPELVRGTRAHRGEVACLDVSAWGGAGGARLATGGGGGDRALRVWRWAPGGGWAPEAEAARAHRLGVTAARWSRGGALLASGGVDGAVRVWSAALRCRRVLAAPGGAAVRALCWAGGARLAAGHDDGAVLVWAVRRGAVLARAAPHAAAVHALAPLAGDELLLTACTDGALKVFHLPALCAAGAGDGEGVGEGEGEAEAEVEGEGEREVQAEAEVTPLVRVDDAHDLGVLCADGTRDGRLAATGGRDATVRVWVARAAGSAPALAPLHMLAGHTAAVTALRWADDGSVLASGSLDRSARLWAAAGGACLHAVRAHARHLTCLALAPDLSYLVTGSNDKTIRTWSLGAFSLDSDLQLPCNALSHFALGDLEGIGPVQAEEDLFSREPALAYAGEGEREREEDGAGSSEGLQEGGEGAQCAWSARAHAGAINCIAAHRALLATASSDGTVKVWRWAETAGGQAEGAEGAAEAELEVMHVLEAHRYPALAADFGAAGSVLLSAGLDGAAYLWDVQSGVQVRALCVPGGGAGGGGVRDARLCARHPGADGALHALLATDDGLAPLYRAAGPDPHPLRVYESASGGEAALCCAWGAGGALCAVGGAGGDLSVFAPPAARALHRASAAHDLGVTSCDFPAARAGAALAGPGRHLLATAGNDSMINFWTIELREEGPEAGAVVRRARGVRAHGGAVSCVRWAGDAGGAGGAGGALLASAGDDRWVRVWRVRRAAGRRPLRVDQCGAISVDGAGGAAAALPLLHPHAEGKVWMVAVGALCGRLALWRVGAHAGGTHAGEDAGEDAGEGAGEDEEQAAPSSWRAAGVARWLRDYVTRVPECELSPAAERALLARARAARLSGASVLHAPVPELLAALGCGDEGVGAGREGSGEGEGDAGNEALRARLVAEIAWLREDAPGLHLAREAPHALLCPLSHRVLRWAVRAADGFTYERDNMLEWLLAAPPGGAVSPVSGRRLRNTRLAPNHALRRALRDFLKAHSRLPAEPAHLAEPP